MLPRIDFETFTPGAPSALHEDLKVVQCPCRDGKGWAVDLQL